MEAARASIPNAALQVPIPAWAHAAPGTLRASRGTRRVCCALRAAQPGPEGPKDRSTAPCPGRAAHPDTWANAAHVQVLSQTPDQHTPVGVPPPCTPQRGHPGGDEPGLPAPSGSRSAWESQPRAGEGLRRGLGKVPLKKFPSQPDPCGWSVGPEFRSPPPPLPRCPDAAGMERGERANIRPLSRFPGPFPAHPPSTTTRTTFLILQLPVPTAQPRGRPRPPYLPIRPAPPPSAASSRRLLAPGRASALSEEEEEKGGRGGGGGRGGDEGSARAAAVQPPLGAARPHGVGGGTAAAHPGAASRSCIPQRRQGLGDILPSRTPRSRAPQALSRGFGGSVRCVAKGAKEGDTAGL